VVWEIFAGREYEFRGPWPFRSVLDLGANVGVFAAFADAQAPDRLLRYIAAEPDEEAFQLLQRQISGLGLDARAFLVQAAVSDHSGALRFDSTGESWGRHVSESGDVVVDGLTVADILDRAGVQEVDLMKMDIEGSEDAVLNAWKTWAPRVRCLVCELHNGLDYTWFARTMNRAGFLPFRAGELFRGQPGAVRKDCVGALLGGSSVAITGG
jgi:FkbM family methyltransferase